MAPRLDAGEHGTTERGTRPVGSPFVSVLDVAAARADELAIDDLTRRRTWAELVDRSVRTGRLLRDELGVAPGARAAMVMGNRVEFLELQLGALLAGVWLTPVNWHLAPDEVAFILADSGAEVVFVDPRFEDLAAAAAGTIPIVRAGEALDALVAGAADEPFPLTGPAGGTMFYTSGTTGRPKGVRRATQDTLGNQLASYPPAGRALGLDGGGPHLVTGPLYHAAPVGFSVMDMHNGAPVVLMPAWDEATCLSLIDEREIRNTHLVPTMFVRLLRLPDDVKASFSGASLHTVLHGAAPIAQRVKAEMIRWWGPVLVEYWGASEGGVVTLVSSEDWLDHPGTVGRPLPNHEVVVTDPESGEPLEAGEVGTLWCRNLTVAGESERGSGDGRVFAYFNDEAKTASAMRGPGTYTIGDLGYVDGSGYVFLADRASHMIISGGVNIYPAEIEHVLVEHPAVADAAVFGIPDDEWGESVKAAVELVDRDAAGPELEAELLAFVRERIAGFKVPRSIDFEDRLPRHESGKLYVRRLREPYWQHHERRI